MDHTKKLVKHHQPSKRLPDDLVMEILPRLPIKSLLRFRCISKSWLALITDCYNKKKIPPAVTGLFCDDCHFIRKFVNVSKGLGGGASVDASLSFLPVHQGLMILDCCNGLLLCRDYHSKSENSRFYVCNPATEKWATIPSFHGAEEIHDFLLTLAFDPHISCHYNIVRISKRRDFPGKINIEVFSSKTGEWAVNNGDTGFCSTSFSFPVSKAVFNGNVHVLTRQNNIISGINSEGQVFRRINFPRPSTYPEIACLGLSGGCLHVAVHAKGEYLQIWALENYDDGRWVSKYSLHSVTLRVKLFEHVFRYQFDKVVFHPDLDNIVFIVARPKILYYNLITAEFGELCGSDSEQYFKCHAYSHFYSEVLGL